MAELRLIDGGLVSALRSQALWHGIAEAMPADGTPTLSLCRSREPYVGLGYHHPLDSLDLEACRRLRLPIIRRRIGGGAVYVDRDQLLFQITQPAAEAPRVVARLYGQCLEPAVAAFRALGLAAEMRGLNDIAVGDRKVSGTGAGRIGGGVTVVGNVIFRFPHRRMTAVLNLGGSGARGECLRLMRRHVSSLADEGLAGKPVGQVKAALVEAYARAFGEPVAASLSRREETSVTAWETRFGDPAWLRGPVRPAPGSRRVKIAEGVWLVAGGDGGLSIRAAVVDGRLERVQASGRGGSSALARLARALTGVPARSAEVTRRLRGNGADGRRLARLLERMT